MGKRILSRGFSNNDYLSLTDTLMNKEASSRFTGHTDTSSRSIVRKQNNANKNNVYFVSSFLSSLKTTRCDGNSLIFFT